MGCEDIHKTGSEKCKELKPETVKNRQGDLILCDDCNERRFGSTKPQSPLARIINRVQLAASPIRSKKPQETDIQTDIQSLPSMPSPIPLAGPSNIDTSVTTPVIKCVEGCQNRTEKAKPVECLLCCAQFHKTCVGIRSNARLTAWMCDSCRGIPQTLKELSRAMKSNKKEISDLRNENATLTKLVDEQRAIIEDMKSQKREIRGGNKKTSSVKNDKRAGTLLIGDSIIKDINKGGLENTDVLCLHGADMEQIASGIKTPEVYEAVIVHGGTNNCTNEQDKEEAKVVFDSMVKEIRQKAPETILYLSTVCPRNDDDMKHQSRVDNINEHIRDIASRTNKCEIIDNDDNFKLRNNETDENTLNGSKLHLSKVGTKRLLRNFNKKREIIKTATQIKREDKDTTRNVQDRNVRERRGGNDKRGRRGCYNCGEKNHQRKDCKHGRPVRCFSCGEVGHKKNMNMC